MPVPGAIKLFILAVVAGAVPTAAQVDQISALREGNRLFREGRFEAAHEAYLRGYDTNVPHSILFYNLGTTAQHLGRLPESILWYRRAETLSPGDPWLQENLETARDTLGLRPYPAPGFFGGLVRNRRLLYFLTALLAWGGVIVWLLRSRHSALIPLVLLGSGLLVYTGTLMASQSAPAAAVLIEDCTSTSGDLPAGSEVWVARSGTTTVEVAAGELSLQCQLEAVARLQSP
jgi:tetratricopeptide (TPR) repeat protein